jgi:hypothetical protein
MTQSGRVSWIQIKRGKEKKMGGGGEEEGKGWGGGGIKVISRVRDKSGARH